jgi:hypothetical protein
VTGVQTCALPIWLGNVVRFRNMNLSNSEWGAVHKNTPAAAVLECSSILASGLILLGRNLEFCFDN